MPAALLHDKLFPLTPLEQSIGLPVKFLVTGRSLEDLKCKTTYTKTSVGNYLLFLHLKTFPVNCFCLEMEEFSNLWSRSIIYCS